MHPQVITCVIVGAHVCTSSTIVLTFVLSIKSGCKALEMNFSGILVTFIFFQVDLASKFLRPDYKYTSSFEESLWLEFFFLFSTKLFLLQFLVVAVFRRVVI